MFSAWVINEKLSIPRSLKTFPIVVLSQLLKRYFTLFLLKSLILPLNVPFSAGNKVIREQICIG